ncbi:hypothetical protein LCGC14_1234830 [marine sediment metagenome]|uniref:DUF3168 domain-containing protein n=1 Tax=marine sediment metagenome TaxID=412755 RepID=A0A0F9LUT3_9ZZZZ
MNGSDLHRHLLDDPVVGALVGTRVYPMVLPQNVTPPAISYLQTGGERSVHTGGSSGLANARVQISCWATTYLGSKALADAARLSLEAFSGELGGGGGRTIVQGAFVSDEREFYESTVRLYRTDLDFEIWHTETRP